MSEMATGYLGSKVWYDLKYDINDVNKIENMYVIRERKGQREYLRFHREDGPARISVDGSYDYYIKGKLHCEDGPASIKPDKTFMWYLDGIKYSFEEWCEKLNKSEEEINFLKLKWNII